MITDLTRRFTVDGVELAWDRWGDHGGVPFLLCHGFSGSSHDWALVVDGLAQRRDVVTIDHRGHGRSEKLRDLSRYSLDRIAADMIAFIDTEVGGPVDLLGHSMGGAVSLRVVLERPDLVRSLILMDTSGWSFQPLDEGMAALLTAFLASFDPADGLPDLGAMANPEDALIAAATPTEWQSMKDSMAAAFDPYAMKGLGRELFDPATASVRHRLVEIDVPVTVIVGANDSPFVDQAADLAAEAGSGQGRLVLIAEAYHSPQLTHPADWHAAVEGHLDGVS